MIEALTLLVMFVLFVCLPGFLLMAWGANRMGRSAGQMLERGRRDAAREEDERP